MKNIVYITLVSLFFFSCSYEKDLFETYKNAPFMLLTYKGENYDILSDSIKISSSLLGDEEINFELKVNDKSNNLQFKYDLLQGQGNLEINNSSIEKNNIKIIKKGNHSFSYLPERTGQHSLELKLIDLYGNVSAKEVNFTIFTNLLPIANFEVVKIGQYSKFEIEIDASLSYDQDEKWGGKIVEYIYKIGSYYELTTSEFSSIKHILPGEGTYVISLQVRDNNGFLSEPYFKEVTF